jgi:hypothetical protein
MRNPVSLSRLATAQTQRPEPSGAIKEEHRRITPALPYFVRSVQDVLHLDCLLSHDWMFHDYDALPVATGHAPYVPSFWSSVTCQ